VSINVVMPSTPAAVPDVERGALVTPLPCVADATTDTAVPASQRLPFALVASVWTYFGIFTAWRLSSWGSAQTVALVNYAALFGPGIPAVVYAWLAARRCNDARTASAWRWLGVSIAFVAAMYVADFYHQAQSGSVPFPSVADACLLAFYPIYLVGLLRFPTRAESSAGRLRVSMDVAITVLGGVSVIWFLVLGPTVTASGQDLLDGLLAGAFPVGDMLQILGLTYLLTRVVDPSTQRALGFLVASTLIVIVGDVTVGWMTLHDQLWLRVVVDVTFMAWWMLFILGAAAQGPSQRSASQPASADGVAVRTGGAGRAGLLAYLTPVVVFGLLVYAQFDRTFVERVTLTVGAALVSLLVLGRQFLVRRDLLSAQDALAGSNERLHQVIATQRDVSASALDFDAVVRVVMESARDLTGAEGAAVHLVAGDELVVRAAVGIAAESRRRRPITGVAADALGTGHPLLIRHLAEDAELSPTFGSTPAWLICAPFFHGSVPAGTVEVSSASADPGLDEQDRNTVALLASMLSAALSQAAEDDARRAQVQSLARFEATFHGAPMAIAMLTPGGAVATTNPAFNAFVGFDEDALRDVSFVGDLVLLDGPEDAELLASLKTGDCDGFRLERQFRRYDGSLVWGDAAIALVRDPDGTPSFAVAMVKDITARKHAEDERDRLETELRLAQKLESVGQLAAGIAHEINTPIQYVSSSVEFLDSAFADMATLHDTYAALRDAAALGDVDAQLLAGVGEAEEIADLEYLRERVPAALERSRDGLARVAKIVGAMREFGHPPTIGTAPVDVNAAVENTLVVAASEYKYVADLTTDLGDLPLVLSNGGDINQVLIILIVNASHAIADIVQGTEQRGAIDIRTRVEDDHAVITIADTGGGIPAAIADRVFDPFFTTKEVGRGTGQGLSIARTIIDRHDGTLTFDTRPGEGTTFTVCLPLKPADAPAAAAAA
jgi:PAS domain S-box-containing protein